MLLHGAAVERRRAKSVVLVFLTGGASHIDTFDPKPDATDIRSDFKPINTGITGVQFTEHLPRLAERANRLAIVRSMAHRDNRHLSASALLDDLQDRGLFDQTLVIMVGEFGRTPRISTLPNAATVGRDHWAWCYSSLLAGAGVLGGQVIGKSDRIGA